MHLYVDHLKSSDINRIIEIERSSFSKDVQESKELYLKRINLFKEGNLGFYADDKLIGFFCSELWHFKERYDLNQFTLNGDFEASHNSKGDELYISSFAIDKQYRSLLKGKEAFNLAINFLLKHLEIKSIILLVGQNWLAARSIYKQWGFKEIAEIEGFFSDSKQDGNKAIIMRSSLA